MTTGGEPVCSPPFLAGDEAVLRVENLCKYFEHRTWFGRQRTVVKAVDNVSFDVARGEAVGLVGESGCGKTTLGRMVLRLIPPTSGRIIVDGEDVTGHAESQLRTFRRRVQVVFQDPYASLDPRQKVGATIAEPLTNLKLSKAEKQRIVESTMERIGLAASQASRFPHQFSGGQRQRIGIARALSVTPELLVLDEPVSALDVSIQAQVLKLLQKLREDLGLSYIFISHDLSVVRHVSDRVMVMYLGRIVEMARKADIYSRPQHPYTVSLLSAAPVPDPDVERVRERIMLPGDPPNPANPPRGCAFHPRCFHAERVARSLPASEVQQLGDGRTVPQVCTQRPPVLAQRLTDGHWSACHFPMSREEPSPASPSSSAASSAA